MTSIIMDTLASEPIQRFMKGDAFEKKAPCPLVYMEANEVETSTENMN